MLAAWLVVVVCSVSMFGCVVVWRLLATASVVSSNGLRSTATTHRRSVNSAAGSVVDLEVSMQSVRWSHRRRCLLCPNIASLNIAQRRNWNGIKAACIHFTWKGTERIHLCGRRSLVASSNSTLPPH